VREEVQLTREALDDSPAAAAAAAATAAAQYQFVTKLAKLGGLRGTTEELRHAQALIISRQLQECRALFHLGGCRQTIRGHGMGLVSWQGSTFFGTLLEAGIASVASLLQEEDGSSKPMPAKLARRIVQQAALALQQCHEHGTVHGDVKAQHLLLMPGSTPGNPKVQLIDFTQAFIPRHISDRRPAQSLCHSGGEPTTCVPVLQLLWAL
jgi:serine/threonine protein kinase